MEKRKAIRTKSLKGIFLQSLTIFSCTVIGTILIFLGGVLESLQLGFVLPANFTENLLKDYEYYMENYESYIWIPKTCEYVVSNEAGSIVETSESLDSVAFLEEYEKKSALTGREYYYTFTYEGNKCIVRYPLVSQFSNPLLNKILPNPTICTIVLFVVIFLIEVIILANRYTKRVSKELNVVIKATKNIQMNQLDYIEEKTQIKELNEVLDSLEHMKEELKNSLKNQWQMEEKRKQQIQSLAHDIKTPLTVLLGNADLLGETELSEEQRDYSEKILNSAEDIETYLSTLLELSRSEMKETIKLTPIKVHPLLVQQQQDARILAQKKNIEIELQEDWKEGYLLADEHAVKRILMNLVSNAIEHTKENGRIRIQIVKTELGEARIDVEDSGRGFTEQELREATELFYQGDESRSTKDHYGLGLYNAKQLALHQNGRLELSNSKDYKGAKVSIYLKIVE